MATITGISDHIGWAELVTLSVRGGAPAILDRRREALVAPRLASAPYHHQALELPLEKAERVVERTCASVSERCRQVLEALRADLGVDAIAVQQSPYDALPDTLAEILSSRALTCAADGMLYREALAIQASALGLAVHRFPRKSDQIAAAAKALGCPASRIIATLADFGRTVGTPWRKEHKHVAAAALAALADHLNG